jgi:hypothetical protein
MSAIPSYIWGLIAVVIIIIIIIILLKLVFAVLAIDGAIEERALYSNLIAIPPSMVGSV